MHDLYILKRSITDFDWEEPYISDLLTSPDEALLEKIADVLEKKHLDDDRSFNYWVVKIPPVIENFEVFEAHADDILDSWED